MGHMPQLARRAGVTRSAHQKYLRQRERHDTVIHASLANLGRVDVRGEGEAAIGGASCDVRRRSDGKGLVKVREEAQEMLLP